MSQAFAFKLLGVVLAAAVSLAVYIWSDLTKTVEKQSETSVATDQKLWQKYGEIQTRQSDQAADLRALGVETGFIKEKVGEANQKLDRLLGDGRGR